MYKEFKYKKQGDKSDSWEVSEYEDDSKKDLINKYMVYEDPTIPPKRIDMSNMDLSTIDIAELKTLLGL